MRTYSRIPREDYLRTCTCATMLQAIYIELITKHTVQIDCANVMATHSVLEPPLDVDKILITSDFWQELLGQQQTKGAKEVSGTLWLVGTLWLAGMFWVAGVSLYIGILLWKASTGRHSYKTKYS